MIRPGRALVRQSPWQGVQTGPSQDFDRPFCKDSHRVHAAIQPTAGPVFIELHRSDASASRAEIIASLQSPAATMSARYLCDHLGSPPITAQCLTDADYTTRTYKAQFATHAPPNPRASGAEPRPVRAAAIDFGLVGGSGQRIARPICRVQPVVVPATIVPLDIGGESGGGQNCRADKSNGDETKGTHRLK